MRVRGKPCEVRQRRGLESTAAASVDACVVATVHGICKVTDGELALAGEILESYLVAHWSYGCIVFPLSLQRPDQLSLERRQGSSMEIKNMNSAIVDFW